MVITYVTETTAGIFQEYRTMSNHTKPVGKIQKRPTSGDVVIQSLKYRMQNIANPVDSPIFDLTLRYKF